MIDEIPKHSKVVLKIFTLLSFVLGFSLMSNLSAQHSHGVLTPGVTFPKNDSVLNAPPQMITMSFRVDVKLLKLALYSAEDQWIDIGFTYLPNRLSHSFVYPLHLSLIHI